MASWRRDTVTRLCTVVHGLSTGKKKNWCSTFRSHRRKPVLESPSMSPCTRAHAESQEKTSSCRGTSMNSFSNPKPRYISYFVPELTPLFSTVSNASFDDTVLVFSGLGVEFLGVRTMVRHPSSLWLVEKEGLDTFCVAITEKGRAKE